MGGVFVFPCGIIRILQFFSKKKVEKY